MRKGHSGNDSPTMSAATYKASRRPAIDPVRQHIAEEILASDCAERRKFYKWLKALTTPPPPQPFPRRI
jgi:hypothetical protein